ncbi:transposase family protein [Yersinia pestis str. Pestoides B]|nr:transposase family protein [Yersinia pestis str. Pestoides B]
MKKTRYTEEQIAFALKQAETGTRVEEVCRKMGISEATFTTGRRSLGEWVSRNCAVFGSLRMRISASNVWWPI